MRYRGRFVLRGAGLAVISLLAAVLLVPFPKEQLASFPSSLILTDRAGQPLRVQLGPHDLDCRPTFKPDREDWIVKAIVAAEDQRFWSHPGIDPIATARAIRQNITALRRVSGASTLSTQVIRLTSPGKRTLWRKAVEAFRALQLERAFAKEEILAQYLSRAPFGSNVVGIEAAARRYFGKGASDLSLGEAALLAGLPQSPSRLRPDRHPERAKKRQTYVLARMEACGFITRDEHVAAVTQPLAIRPAPYPFRAPHFCAMVEDQPGDFAPASGEAVRTSLDAGWQRIVEDALKRHAEVLGRGEIRGGAVVVLDVKTGAVRALAGSPDFFDKTNKGQVNAALAPRSAGSTLKPFAYALAMDRGLATPQTVLADVPKLYRDYEPENFDESFRGLVTARDALVLSLNMPAIDVEQRVGQPVFHRTLRSLGFGTLSRPASHYGLGLVLGNGEVRLLDLANAYACLARGGEYRPFTLIEDDAAATVPGKRVFSTEACWLVADMLGGEERSLDTTGHAADVRLPPMAWKTGTSAGFRDAWTVAYNPEIVIGVWVGNPDGASSEQLVGRKVATPIVWEIFRRIYPDNDGPWFQRPDGLVARAICETSGMAPGPNCRHLIEDWSIRGTTRFESCSVHRRGETELWPAEIASFLDRQRAVATTRESRTSPAPRIVSPAPGSTYRLLDGMAEETQQLPLAAAGGTSGQGIHWFVDDRYLGAAAPGGKLLWPLERGQHQVVCSDAAGRSDRIEITVE